MFCSWWGKIVCLRIHIYGQISSMALLIGRTQRRPTSKYSEKEKNRPCTKTNTHRRARLTFLSDVYEYALSLCGPSLSVHAFLNGPLLQQVMVKELLIIHTSCLLWLCQQCFVKTTTVLWNSWVFSLYFQLPLWWQEEVLEVIFREIGLDSNSSLAFVTPFVLGTFFGFCKGKCQMDKNRFSFSYPTSLWLPPLSILPLTSFPMSPFRQYYEMLYNTADELLNLVVDQGVRYTELEYINALSLLHRSQTGVGDLSTQNIRLQRLKEIICEQAAIKQASKDKKITTV